MKNSSTERGDQLNFGMGGNGGICCIPLIGCIFRIARIGFILSIGFIGPFPSESAVKTTG